MILIGQYDSPFVRRVAIALALCGRAFDHRPWSTFGDAARIRAYSPLTKAPTLVLDDGTVLVDSHLIIDWLETGIAPEASLWPREPAARTRAYALTGLATGAADAAVSLFYETALHGEPSAMLTERRRRQLGEALEGLDRAVAETGDLGLFGARPGHADIAIACAFGFIRAAHAPLVGRGRFAALDRFSDRLEASAVFAAHHQRFIAPA